MTNSAATSNWMLYGCYGYSGRLILREAVKEGLSPTIAGRSEKKTKALADEFNLPYKVFDLSSSATIEAAIEGFDMVFNAAGPYTSTCIPMLQACLNQKVHNLSLAGEIPILEELYRYHDRAKAAEIVVAAGLGFDVMPTDALAAKIKEALPDATDLIIGLDGPNDMSRGSMKEFFEQLGEQPFWIRENGELVESKPRTTRMDFGNGEKLASSIAWGDTASAFHSTGIPNINVFASVSRTDWLLIKSLTAFRFLFKSKIVQRTLNKCIDICLEGPNDKTLEQALTHLYAEGRNASGELVKASMTTPSAYKITYLGAVHAIKYILTEEVTCGGYYTPAQLLGYRSIEEIEGVSRIALSA